MRAWSYFLAVAKVSVKLFPQGTLTATLPEEVVPLQVGRILSLQLHSHTAVAGAGSSSAWSPIEAITGWTFILSGVVQSTIFDRVVLSMDGLHIILDNCVVSSPEASALGGTAEMDADVGMDLDASPQTGTPLSSALLSGMRVTLTMWTSPGAGLRTRPGLQCR